MYFIHVADRHIGESTSICPDALQTRHHKVLEQMVSLTWKIKEQYSLSYLPPWIDCGDLFHKRNMTRSIECYVLHNFTAYLDYHLEWIMIAGNHDLVSFNPPYSHLSLLNIMEQTGKFSTIHVVEFAPRVFSFSHSPNVKVLAIPYGLNFPEIIKSTLDHYYQEGDFWIVMLHECIIGSRVASGTEMSEGKSLVNDPRIGYYALGDIHEFQKLNHPQPAFYSGSPIQMNFGDKLPKGVLLVNTDDPWNPQLIDLGLPTFVTCTQQDNIPENAGFVRMTVDATVDTKNLDPRVVQTIPVVSETSKQLLNQISLSEYDFNPLDGLDTYLQHTNLSQEQQEMGCNYVKQLFCGSN